MNLLHFSDNIVRMRHEKKITQEQLADFVGVTKASVSKWETGQSLPDILLLPKLAAFFDVTIDQLLGYEPQLSREQIQKIYHSLAARFAEAPFEEAMAESQALVKKYYSCYPFLFQICCLWLNHYMLASGEKRRMEILAMISGLCCHIISSCRNCSICENASILKASVCIQQKNPQEAVEVLEDLLNPAQRLSSQSSSLLIQAYMLAGEKDKADSFAQISMFLHLGSLTADAAHYLTLHSANLPLCEETIRRVQAAAAAYDLEHLNPNLMAGFQYQSAVIYCMHKKKPEALHMLHRYAANVTYLLKDDNLSSHGDSYFNRIHQWYEKLDIGADAPRDIRVIRDSYYESLEHPAFALLDDEPEFQKIKKQQFS